ncbi:MAG: copper resistance protein CopC [Actinomycetia bacterium]|nr:copper resistance protein CopC [Actinomycetes bacterium]
MTSWSRRLGAVLVLTLLGVGALAAPASAHAVLLDTTPEGGSFSATPPRTVTLHFGEDVTTELGAIRVFDSRAQRIATPPATHPNGDGTRVQVRLPQLGRGSYVVTWRVVSADAHPVQGAFTFGVGPASAAASARSETLARSLLGAGGSAVVGALFAVVRVGVFAGLALLIGGVVFLLVVWPGGRPVPRARRIIGTGWWLTLVGTVAGILVQGPYATALGIGHVFDVDLIRSVLDTRFGHVELARLVLLVLAVPLLGVLRRGRRLPAWWNPAAVAVGVGLALTPGLSGHAAIGIQWPLALLADTVHVGAMAVWLGGLAVLGFVALRLAAAEELVTVLPRFSRIAFGSVCAIVVTGVYQSWRQVGSVHALTSTDFGRLLIAKVIAFVVLLALADVSRRAVQARLVGRLTVPSSAGAPEPELVAVAASSVPVSPGPGSPAAPTPGLGEPSGPPRPGEGRPDSTALRSLRRSVAVELVLALVVLTLTGLLVNAQPARAAEHRTFATINRSSSKLWFDLEVDPARPGVNDVHITALQPKTGVQASVVRIGATMTPPGAGMGPITLKLRELGPGHYIAPGPDLPIRGRWTLTVRALVDEFDAVTVHQPVDIR